MSEYTFTPIGILHSPFREKFGIPRQPGLAPHAISRLVLSAEVGHAACVDGLEGFSHLWLMFVAHASIEQGWQPSVRPPRLGGNAKVGVFASRSLFRPNPVGLSLVELIRIVDGEHGKELLLRGADVLDGTPVLDIKPYLPWADSAVSVRAGFAQAPPHALPVRWSQMASQQADALGLSEDRRALVQEVLAQDPRPAYRNATADTHTYGVWLDDVNVCFAVQGGIVNVLSLSRCDPDQGTA